MTIKDAVAKALNEWASDPDFDINDKQVFAESLLQEAFEDWADENGYTYDDESCLFVRSN